MKVKTHKIKQTNKQKNTLLVGCSQSLEQVSLACGGLIETEHIVIFLLH